MKNLPPTQGRGKWGRKIRNSNSRRHNGHVHTRAVPGRIVIEERTGSGVRIRVTTGVIRPHLHTPGIIRQNFFSSPRLREWFDRQGAAVDARIELSERAEYERLCRESAAYRARKAAQKKARAV